MARYKRRPQVNENDLQPGLFDEFLPKPSAGDEAEFAAMRRDFAISNRQPAANSGQPRRSAYDNYAPEPPHNIEPLKPATRIERLNFISFGSGSSGNCSYLGDDRFGVLIDAGVDSTKVVNELQRHAIKMTSIGGIILTHDHGDHVRYAYAFLRRFQHLRLYCTPKALNGILRRHNVSRRIKDYHQPIFVEHPFHIGNFVITPFSVPHDGTDNCGFYISAGNQSFVVATDMGRVSERADYYMRQANHLMIEANYDLEMLLRGPYPEYLKARIISERGHMDNAATAAYLKEMWTPRLNDIFLCHLSHDNNTPPKALESVGDALTAAGAKVGDGSGSLEARQADVQLTALPRFDATGVIVLRSDHPHIQI